MAAGTNPAVLPVEVAEVCREIFLMSNTGELVRGPVFVETFSATVRNMLAHKTVFENYLGGQFIVEGKQCFSARDRTRCIAELVEDKPARAVIKLPESSLGAVNQVLDYCSLVHAGTLSEANLALKAKQLAASSTQVQLYELATVHLQTAYCLDVKALVQVSTQEISKRMTDAFKNPAFLSKALKSSGLSANAINRLDMNARSLKKKSELAAKLNPKETADAKANVAAQPKAPEEKEKAVSEAEKLRRKRRKEKQKERKKLLKLQAEGDSQDQPDGASSQPGVPRDGDGESFIQRFPDGTIALSSEDDLANLADNADDSDVESDREDFDNEIEEFRRRLESFGPTEPVSSRVRIPTTTPGQGLKS